MKRLITNILLGFPLLVAAQPPQAESSPQAAEPESNSFEIIADTVKVPLNVPGVDSILKPAPGEVINRSFLQGRVNALREHLSQQLSVPETDFSTGLDPIDIPALEKAFTSDTIRLKNGKSVDIPMWHMWVRYVIPEGYKPLDLAPATIPVKSGELRPGRYWYIKTNAPAWGMLWMNLAIEVETGSHWSFALPAYYSGFNYFTRTLKFRTWNMQPEMRYWFHPGGTGPYIGAHMGFAFYNVAFDGDKRYQDHGAKRPAWGGGLAIGYRWHFTRNPHWFLEASIGGGCYKLDYDIFENVPNGLLIDRKKRTFWGVDQATFSFCYRFNAGKGGKK